MLGDHLTLVCYIKGRWWFECSHSFVYVCKLAYVYLNFEENMGVYGFVLRNLESILCGCVQILFMCHSSISRKTRIKRWKGALNVNDSSLNNSLKKS